jgi:hypothetical protein
MKSRFVLAKASSPRLSVASIVALTAACNTPLAVVKSFWYSKFDSHLPFTSRTRNGHLRIAVAAISRRTRQTIFVPAHVRADLTISLPEMGLQLFVAIPEDPEGCR